jgi:hypothetical protein
MVRSRRKSNGSCDECSSSQMMSALDKLEKMRRTFKGEIDSKFGVLI